jgi:hypothetical protein
MELENIITKIVNKKLNNPIFELLKEIKIKTILKRSNFIKKNGIALYLIILHFIYMIIKDYRQFKKIKYTYFSTIVRHSWARKLKIVFIKNNSNLISIVSTNLNLSDEEIIELYKRR